MVVKPKPLITHLYSDRSCRTINPVNFLTLTIHPDLLFNEFSLYFHISLGPSMRTRQVDTISLGSVCGIFLL